MWIPLNIGMLWSTDWKYQRLIHRVEDKYYRYCFIVLSVMLQLAVFVRLYQLQDYDPMLQEYQGSWEQWLGTEIWKACTAVSILAQSEIWLTMKSDSRLERKLWPDCRQGIQPTGECSEPPGLRQERSSHPTVHWAVQEGHSNIIQLSLLLLKKLEFNAWVYRN